MRAALIGCLALSAFSLTGEQAHATELVPNLYIGKTITTGVIEEHRPAALARCFIDVLVKVSGDPRLATDADAAKLADQAATFVRAFRYRDRLEGKPIHDEQGTRDRPHDFIVEFEPQQIDGALRGLGRQPWPAERPKLALAVSVRFGELSYILTQDEPRGVNQREALDAASLQIGVPVTLPPGPELTAANLKAGELETTNLDKARELANRVGADLTMVGTMVFSDEAQGWIVDWQLYQPAGSVRWQVRGVNYDEAFRVGLRGAAQVLSGNGHPL